MRRNLQTRDGITVCLVRLELRSPYYGAVETRRTLRIYQGNGEDPLAAVAAVVRELDWARVAQVEVWA
ncbi:MAG: hypothetical protein AAF928_01660 [Myxococcota bacterium]